jgi:hypothetical protein
VKLRFPILVVYVSFLVQFCFFSSWPKLWEVTDVYLFLLFVGVKLQLKAVDIETLDDSPLDKM